MKNSIAICVASAMLSACGLFDPGKVTTGISPNIEDQQKFVKVDLVALLDPEQKMRRQVSKWPDSRRYGQRNPKETRYRS